MARKKGKTTVYEGIDVNGLSVNDILQIPYENLARLSRKDLAKVASRLVSASNKRIRRLEKAKDGHYNPSLSYIQRRGGQFSVKGKNVNQIRNEFKQMKHFLNMKTSTVKGYKNVVKKFQERVGSLTQEQQTKFWSVYKRLEETSGGLMNIINDSDKIQEMLHDEIVEYDDDTMDIYQRMLNNLDVLYEEMFENPDVEDTDDVFTFEYDL